MSPNEETPRRKIMLVDDAPDVHELVQIWLMEEPVDLTHCYDGGTCLASAAQEAPDLFLLDVDMPGTSGFAVCAALKQNKATANIPVIFLTGASSSEEKLHGLELGATDYITKPFDPAELRARVRAALRTRQLMELLHQRAITLQQSEEEYRATFELASVGKAQVDASSGQFLRVNAKFCQITRFERDHLQTSTFFELLHPADRSSSADLQCLLRGETPDQTLEQRCLRPDGQTIWVEVSAAPIRDDSGKPVRVVCVVQDITGRKRAETLEKVQREILQMIASGQPLADTLRRLVLVTASQCEMMSPGLMLLTDGRFRLAEGLAGQAGATALLEQHSVRLASALLTRVGGQQTVLATRGDEALWDCLGDASVRPRAIWFSPFHASSGDIIGFYLLLGSVERLPTPFECDLLQTVSRLTTIAVEHRKMADQMTHRAQHDALTGLPNRILFEDRLQQAITQCNQDGTMAALIYADLDRFKLINDTLGHHAGDELLQGVVARWSACLRPGQTLARLGGDEFAFVLPQLRAATDATAFAQNLLESLRESLQIAGHSVVATSSLGVALFPLDGTDTQSLHQSADAAMYRTKRSGRNGFRCSAPEVNSAAAERRELEGRLRGAADRGELELYFQPIVGRDRHLTGLEALLRWNSPDFGMISPDRFIPIAEEAGLIVSIGAWAVMQACRQTRQWLDEGLTVPPVSVNASALQFARPDFVHLVQGALQDSGLTGDRIVLEITETVLMQGREDLSSKLSQLRSQGIRIAIDDFGTGYSSLSYLQRLPIDTLKIDRSFVADMGSRDDCMRGQPQDVAPRPARGKAIVGAIILMAHELGMRVVAEGVETDIQSTFLTEVGCDSFQGYLFGRPAPASIVGKLLRSPTFVREPGVAA